MLGTGLAGNAQVNKHTFGFRFSPTNGHNIGNFTYQLGLNERSRLDFGLNLGGGFGKHGGNVNGMFSVYYHRVRNINKGLNVFYGFGGAYNFAGSSYYDNGQFNQQFSLGGKLGIEYDFSKHNFPLIVGLDYNPQLRLSQGHAALNKNNFGLSLRYVIK